MSKEFDVYLSRLPQRVTDNIFLQWRSKYQQDDLLLDTEDLESSLSINPVGLPSRHSETARFTSPLVYNQVMRESILCSYKSIAILRSIIRDLSNGQQTYSDVSAYLANMLLGRAICLLLGVWFSPCKINGDYYLIDLFFKKPTGYETRAFNLKNFRMNHEVLWKLFINLIKNTQGTYITPQISSFINSINPSDFASHRNHLQYSYHNWTFNDLIKDDEVECSWFTDYQFNLALDFQNFTSHANKLMLLELLGLFINLFSSIAVMPEQKEHLQVFQASLDNYKQWI